MMLMNNITYLICDPNGSAPGLSEEEQLGLGLGLGLGLPFLLFLLWICAKYSNSGAIEICGCTLYESERIRNLRIETQPIGRRIEPVDRQWNPELRHMLTLAGYQNLIHDNLTPALKAELDSIKLRDNGRAHLLKYQEHACDKGAIHVVRYIETILQQEVSLTMV